MTIFYNKNILYSVQFHDIKEWNWFDISTWVPDHLPYTLSVFKYISYLFINQLFYRCLFINIETLLPLSLSTRIYLIPSLGACHRIPHKLLWSGFSPMPLACKSLNESTVSQFSINLQSILQSGEKVLVLKRKFRENADITDTSLTTPSHKPKLAAPKRQKLLDHFPVRDPSPEADEPAGNMVYAVLSIMTLQFYYSVSL